MPFSEISVRLKSDQELYSKVKIATSMDVAFLMGEEISGYKENTMALLNLNAAGQVINVDIGSITYFKNNIRESITRSILSNTANTVLISNGANTPEKSKLTKEYGTAYATVGINIMDHICRDSKGGYYSYNSNDEDLVYSDTKTEITVNTENENMINSSEDFLRLKTRTIEQIEGITTKEAAIEHVAKELQQLDREAVYIICSDSDGIPLNYSLVSLGDLNSSLVNSRELFKIPLLTNAASVIMMHNHPSGNITPSMGDHTTTEAIHIAGIVLGISLEDHIIVAGKDKEERYSFKEHYLMPYQRYEPEPEQTIQQPKFELKKAEKAHTEAPGKQNTASKNFMEI